jgi:outer membrane lipoprotein-sorting protein/peroxiredoxin
MENLLSENLGQAAQPGTFPRHPGASRLFRAATRSCVGLALLVCVSALTAFAADTPDAATILKRAAASYQALKSYQAHITVQSIDGNNVAEKQFVETGSGDSFRCEEADPQGLLRVSDGHTLWSLDRGTNEYVKSDASGANESLIGQLAQIDGNVKDASVDDEELYWPNGAATKVYIVEVTRNSWPSSAPAGAQSITYTIDENTFEVYKSITYTNAATQVALYSITQRDQPASDSLFSFAPPASARRVDALPPERFAYKSIIGIEAPDFSLKNAPGKIYSLHDFRGKAVVIDFVGSWCPPCLAEMPYLQQENDTYPPKDLEVFGLDVGEDAKQVNDFGLNAAFTFPLLVGAEPDVTAKYFVGDYPTTYVIDRQGRIIFKSTGTENPGGFLAAVKAAVAGTK